MTDPSNDPVMAVLLDQIARQDLYIKAMGTGFVAVAVFFGYKWLNAMVENSKSDAALAASNEKLTEAVKGMTEAVLRCHKGE